GKLVPGELLPGGLRPGPLRRRLRALRRHHGFGERGERSVLEQELQLLRLERLALEQRVTDPVERGAVVDEQLLRLFVELAQDPRDLFVDLARLEAAVVL